jgi:hypothetical protein
MTRDRLPTVVAALALLVAALAPAWAGGPLGISAEGEPLRWDASRPVRYVLDRGALGARSHEAAAAMVARAVRAWQDVPTARLRFEAAGELTLDVNGKNVMAFLNGLKAGSACPILFDADGSITETVFGKGADELGFAKPWFTSGRYATILVSYMVLNGAGLDDYADGYACGVAEHELGHAIGLDHSQLNSDQFYDGDPANDSLSPVMSYSRGPNDAGELHRDDQAWYSYLYPTDAFTAGTGSIRGRVLLPDRMTGLRGVNVVARRVGDPQVTAVCALSGYLFSGDFGGLPDPAHLGEFLIPGLPPGAYTLELQGLDDKPTNRVPHGGLPGGPKQWREGSSAQDPPGSGTPIMVSAAQTVSGIDVVVNAEDLGEPAAVAEKEPNSLPAAQSVSLPAVVTGAVEDADEGTAGPPIKDASDLPNALQDVYRVTLREPTVLTAILSAAQRGADLDLYVIRAETDKLSIVASSTGNGTPPETVQINLPAGRYYVGVHRAADRGSAYTLRLLATPAPEPANGPDPAWINYLIVGDVTPTGAAVRWQTTGDTPAVVWYHRPLREIGSTRRSRDHAFPLTELAAGQRSTVEVYARSEGGVDYTMVPITAASPPAPDGAPRLVLGSTADSYASDFAEVQLRLTNRGDADAEQVRIEQVTPAPGWVVISQELTREPLPDVLERGRMGAGGAGALVVRLVRRGGTAPPELKVKGSYLDRAGAAFKF